MLSIYKPLIGKWNKYLFPEYLHNTYVVNANQLLSVFQ